VGSFKGSNLDIKSASIVAPMKIVESKFDILDIVSPKITLVNCDIRRCFINNEKNLVRKLHLSNIRIDILEIIGLPLQIITRDKTEIRNIINSDLIKKN
jgi:hypothetical protein